MQFRRIGVQQGSTIQTWVEPLDGAVDTYTAKASLRMNAQQVWRHRNIVGRTKTNPESEVLISETNCILDVEVIFTGGGGAATVHSKILKPDGTQHGVTFVSPVPEVGSAGAHTVYIYMAK